MIFVALSLSQCSEGRDSPKVANWRVVAADCCVAILSPQSMEFGAAGAATEAERLRLLHGDHQYTHASRYDKAGILLSRENPGEIVRFGLSNGASALSNVLADT